MKEIRIQSFAKINLSIDVTGVTGDGMHRVDTVSYTHLDVYKRQFYSFAVYTIDVEKQR